MQLERPVIVRQQPGSSWLLLLLPVPGQARPFVSLFVLFVVWKTFLLSIAIFSPGHGYDSSTNLLLARAMADGASRPFSLSGVLQKLVRWDAIYFTELAARGYRFEQEWAFGWGFTRLLGRIANALLPPPASVADIALVAVLVSHLCHLLSAIVLYSIVAELITPSHTSLAFWTAALHVLSPAGLFLSAPYGESLFSLLSFLGFLCYLYSKNENRRARNVYTLASGSCFALACTVRGNGLLNAAVFLYDVVGVLPNLYQTLSQRSTFLRLVCETIAGCLVAIGAAYPQWVAYNEYCSKEVISKRRPWCTQLPPSIYTWVQRHYWNVGFLRYWTVSNIPLFLLAAPSLYILLYSSLLSLQMVSVKSPLVPQSKAAAVPHPTNRLIDRLAVPQLLLALLAATSFHVQIINRISSGYPLWYISIAASLIQDPTLAIFSFPQAKAILHLMIIYAMVQGGLFASFLPPA